jgi:hypothetical protein
VLKNASHDAMEHEKGFAWRFLCLRRSHRRGYDLLQEGWSQVKGIDVAAVVVIEDIDASVSEGKKQLIISGSTGGPPSQGKLRGDGESWGDVAYGEGV